MNEKKPGDLSEETVRARVYLCTCVSRCVCVCVHVRMYACALRNRFIGFLSIRSSTHAKKSSKRLLSTYDIFYKTVLHVLQIYRIYIS